MIIAKRNNCLVLFSFIKRIKNGVLHCFAMSADFKQQYTGLCSQTKDRLITEFI